MRERTLKVKRVVGIAVRAQCKAEGSRKVHFDKSDRNRSGCLPGGTHFVVRKSGSFEESDERVTDLVWKRAGSNEPGPLCCLDDGVPLGLIENDGEQGTGIGYNLHMNKCTGHAGILEGPLR